MPLSLFRSRQVAERIHQSFSREQFVERLRPRLPREVPLPRRLPGANVSTAAGLRARQEFVEREYGLDIGPLKGTSGQPTARSLSGNIENLIGFAQVPIGVIGPLRVNGVCAHGDFSVPLATTEGALVASCQRGAYVLSRSGGVTAMCLTESVARAPCFVFDELTAAAMFMDWVMTQVDAFSDLVARSTSHGELQDVKLTSCGTLVYLIFEYTTGDAAGQNMVTLATEEVCEFLVANAPIKPRRWYVEGNLSGDKKASMLSFMGARGKKVVASAEIPPRLVERFLHTRPEEMAEYCLISALGGVQSGSIGVQGHYANALAAIFIACGQDAACVSEAAVGITQMSVAESGGLHASVSLPNLVVGTVGGGTRLPTARACLGMMDCVGPGKARAFAEICAAAVLAGEVSIIAAMAAGDFAKAHAEHRPRPK